MLSLAKEIIKGRRLKKGEDLSFFLSADLEELSNGADRIRQELCGEQMDLCSIINGRGGSCSENCKFCAQSAYHQTDCDVYDFLPVERFVEGCIDSDRKGVNRYSIVTAGRSLEGKDLEIAVDSYRAMHESCPEMILCASHGLMAEKDLKRLADAGVSMYHANIETSERYFPEICTTHSFEDKLEEIRRARAAGHSICSGGILGMGESWEDRIDMALTLADHSVESIPLNFLIPVRGTPLENQRKLSPEEIIRIVAIFRYLNPAAYIRIAAGRNYFQDGGAILFRSGANAALTGDMLTTVGNNTFQDRKMMTDLGLRIRPLPDQASRTDH